MIYKLKRLILHWCLLIAGRIDEVATSQVRLGTTVEVNIKKIIPPDGKPHRYGITMMFEASMTKNHDGYIGYLTSSDIKVYQAGAICRQEPEDGALFSTQWEERNYGL